MNKDPSEKRVIQVNTYEFFQIRALCDEIMNNLCQARALLVPVSEEDFFQRLDEEVLRHYFYALDTIIDNALAVKDEICQVVDHWEQEKNKESKNKKSEIKSSTDRTPPSQTKAEPSV